MIKALMLILDPLPTWERILIDRRSWGSVLVTHLLPLLVLTSAAEGLGLAQWGRTRGSLPPMHPFSVNHVLFFESAQFLLSLLTVFLGAKLIKSVGDTFHGRHSFTQTFTVAVYGLSPMFLLRAFNAFPVISPWITWAIGMLLSAAVLYHGLPRVMQPDPPHAFGLYLMSVLFLFMITGLICFLTAWYLQGRFGKLDEIVTRLMGS
jgi:hypothetical protein